MDDTYYRSKGGKIPVKWTAPEVINYNRTNNRLSCNNYCMSNLIKLTKVCRIMQMLLVRLALVCTARVCVCVCVCRLFLPSLNLILHNFITMSSCCSIPPV